MELSRRKIDDKVEERILTGLIVSDTFCKQIIPIINRDTFASPYTKEIAKWCIEYFERYNEAPAQTIQELFDFDKSNLRDEDREMISVFLDRIADEYADGQKVNVEYLKDISVEYIRKRNLAISVARADEYMENGNLDEAEKEIQNYNKVYADTDGWENPLSRESIAEYFLARANKENELFRFDGALGGMIGTLERNWLVGFLAPVKRGKTWWLIEMAKQAIQGCNKCIFISLEMDKHRIKDRIYKALTAQCHEGRDFKYPVFDCLSNQDNSCKKPERTNNKSLLSSIGQKPEYDATLKYNVCTACRMNNKKEYKAAYWFITDRPRRMEQKAVSKHIEILDKQFKRSLRVRSYPAYSANISRIKSDIEILENSQGFVPDVIIIDYADILAPEDSRITGRERLDDTWKMLKNLSDERHCLVVTASQSNRKSFKKKHVTQTDIAEDIRKLAHVDAMMSLNQTPEEKHSSVMRVNMIALRGDDFDEYASCIVTQQLKLGQVCLDSQMAPITRFEEDDEEK
jgi:replicative DNA helicase